MSLFKYRKPSLKDKHIAEELELLREKEEAKDAKEEKIIRKRAQKD